MKESSSPRASPALRPAGAAAADNSASRGLAFGIAAYSLWGIFPIYFRALAHVSPTVVLCHRVVWSVMFLGALIQFRGEWPAIVRLLRSPRSLSLLALGAFLIGVNWLIFIYAVGSGQVLEASLGYFINPLVSIALGVVFLKERLRPWQWAAVAIVVIAVMNMAVQGAGLPWIAVSLALTFAFYGLVRKKVDANSLHGLLVETAVLLPLALPGLLLLPGSQISSTSWALLSVSGVITAIPLLLFGAAVRRLKLSTIGFLQYIGPTMQFFLAIFVFGERLQPAKLASFALCWLAIGVYVADSVIHRQPQEVADQPE